MYVLFKQKITLLETTFFIVLLKNVWGEKDKEHCLLSERYWGITQLNEKQNWNW